MPLFSFAPSARRTLLALVAFALFWPANAMALSLMDPFNLPGAMDGGASKVGDDIAYADGPRHHLDVYAPEKRGDPAPVVFFIYGGGWNRGERSDYQYLGRAFAARGFVTVIADYRLVPEVHYPEFLEDNAAALRWTQDHIAEYGGDPKRVFLAGHSAGAYNAVMLALEPSFRQEYGVTIPILGVAALSGPYDFYPFEYGEVQNAFGDTDNPEGTQPINLVTSNAPAMFLAAGTTDPIVRVQNTENLAAKLQANGIWVTTKYYEGFGHMEPVIAIGALWRWRAPVLDDMVEFFTRFGAFPSGVPYAAVTPEAPAGETERIDRVMDQLDGLFEPVTK
ncbi:alpha/beta hydrolase [Devosia sp.]|uniref:alpha/beta hydrolase n=1 Tax=Devosia sp. TaxID=1871048 RepID=UPI003264A886